MVDIYDSSRGLVKIGPCKWSSNLDVAFWLSQKDDIILKVLAIVGDTYFYIFYKALTIICHLSPQSLGY